MLVVQRSCQPQAGCGLWWFRPSSGPEAGREAVLHKAVMKSESGQGEEARQPCWHCQVMAKACWLPFPLVARWYLKECLPLSCLWFGTYRSQEKEMHHILLWAGYVPTFEIQIDGTDIFSHLQNLKFKAVKKHKDWDSPHWPLCTAVAHVRTVIWSWSPRVENL